MSILIKDETANALVFFIDNEGNMTFGDGTPINILTINGYGIIDDGGNIVHGLGSNSVACVSGSAFVDYVGSGNSPTVTIATVAGRMPTVQVDSDFPADQATFSQESQSIQHTPLNKPSVTIFDVRPGSFTAKNSNIGDDDPHTTHNGFSTGPAVPTGSGSFVYRWL